MQKRLVWSLGGRDDSGFAELESVYIPPTTVHCEQCGRKELPLLSLIWEDGSDRVADFTQAGGRLVVQRHIGETLRERFSGVGTRPVTFVDHPNTRRPAASSRRRKKRVWLPYEGPELCELVATRFALLATSSTVELHGVCSLCGYARWGEIWGVEEVRGPRGTTLATRRAPGGGVVVLDAAIPDPGLFGLAGLSQLFCTDEVRRFVEMSNFNNVEFLEYGEVDASHGVDAYIPASESPTRSSPAASPYRHPGPPTTEPGSTANIDGSRDTHPHATPNRTVGDQMTHGSPVRFGLHWAGKAAARALARAPSSATLHLDPKASLEWQTTEHVFVEGDNLEVLKTLRRSLAGRVRLVFIDPPYNTGQNFVYPDRFTDGVAAYLQRSGQADARADGTANAPETAGRHHARWLDMMLPRLILARELLAPDGALFITIDHHEVHHLRMLLDEVFGRESFVACCAWQKTFAKKNKALISGSHDHVLVVARDIRSWERNLWPRTEAQLAAFRNPDHDPRGPWQSVAFSVPSEDGARRAAYRYAIDTPSGVAVHPPAGRHWNGLPGRTAALRADGRLWFGPGGDRRPRLKVFLSEVQGGIVPDTWWTAEAFGHNQEAKKELLALFDDAEPFSTPKPTRLIRRILQMATRPHTNDLVVDFFAGSGTTGHAVWQQNALDGGNRRFLLVQLPHPTPDPTWPTISAFARERLRRAALRVEGPGDRGFRAFRLAAPARTPWSTDPTPLARAIQQQARPRARQEPLQVAVDVALELGHPPRVRIETDVLGGIAVLWVASGALLVCPAHTSHEVQLVVDALVEQVLEGGEPAPPVVALREEALPTDALRLEVCHRLRSAGVTRVLSR